MKTSRTDRVGLALLGAWLAWVVVTATLNHRTQPLMTPYFTSPLTLLAGVLLGRRLARIGVDVRVAMLLLAVTTYLLWAVVFVGGAGGGPLGYANANAALAVQLTALAALLALDASGRVRLILLGAAALLAIAVVPTRSDAAIVVVVPLIGAIALALAGRVSRKWWPVTTGVVGVAGAAASVIGLTLMSAWPQRLVGAFSTTRHGLWNDALALWAKHPLIGSGPGSFRRFSELAKNPDHQTAHMSLLQIGAETGLVGVLLFAALVAVGFAIATRGRPAATLVVSAALAALLIHSFVDHLLEYWPVMLVMGVSLGYATLAYAASNIVVATPGGSTAT